MKHTTQYLLALSRGRENAHRVRIMRRLRRRPGQVSKRPVIGGGSVRYDVAKQPRGLAHAGIGLIKSVVNRAGLATELNRSLSLLKRHSPYWDSDHILNIALCILAGGTSLEDIKRLRQDEAYLSVLGADRLPDATTAGDYCRRFQLDDVEALMKAVNRSRLKIWREQPEHFRGLAIIDADGTLAPTTGERKQGMDISYKGTWGYHPLLVSLANTNEVLYLENRPGNRTSSEGASARFDQAIELCREGGFGSILLRGDTDFSQTEHLDRWDDDNVEFVFGMNAVKGLIVKATALPDAAWSLLERRPKYEVKTQPRSRRLNYKQQIIRERGYKNITLNSESVAEFQYRPTACKKSYRMVVVRKNLTVEQGREGVLFDDIRYFFYISNERELTAAELVTLANERCNQENIIKELKSGVHAMSMPVHELVSNWAYMVIASLAWTLKAWFALSLPTGGRWHRRHAKEKGQVLRMTFRTFTKSFIEIPGIVVSSARRTTVRLLAWNEWQRTLLRAAAALSQPMLC